MSDELIVTQLVSLPFLLFPKIATKEHATGDVRFRKFCQQLFHCLLSKILETLHPGITKYKVAHFSNGHFCCVIYGLGPYIADYKKQVLLTCIMHEHNHACTAAALALELSIPHFLNILQHFLFAQLNPNDPCDPSEVPLAFCPQFDSKISVFNLACSRFFAPSDLSGIGGMCFVQWFGTIGDSPDKNTGMWVVQPAHNANNTPHIAIIHIDSIYHTAHLIPVCGTQPVPPQHQHHPSGNRRELGFCSYKCIDFVMAVCNFNDMAIMNYKTSVTLMN
ncbi:hypothetical protein EV424DRAFT_1346032 [Suillus variegatus]|nr:hypothetical protein EV424DRAFT_1346032 [Suillus variegatus]